MGMVHKFGANDDVDTGSDPEDIWDVGGLYSFLSAASTSFEVSSDDANDTAAGSGAQSVCVVGCDENYQQVTETVATNGVTPVSLSSSFYRVFRAYVIDVGAGGVNAGNIDIAIGATVYARISAGKGQTLMAIYTVSEKGGLLKNYHASLARQSNGAATIDLMTREPGKSWRVRDEVGLHSSGGPWSYDFGEPSDQEGIVLPAGTDVKLTVAEVTANNTTVAAGFKIREHYR